MDMCCTSSRTRRSDRLKGRSCNDQYIRHHHPEPARYRILGTTPGSSCPSISTSFSPATPRNPNEQARTRPERWSTPPPTSSPARPCPCPVSTSVSLFLPYSIRAQLIQTLYFRSVWYDAAVPAAGTEAYDEWVKRLVDDGLAVVGSLR